MLKKLKLLNFQKHKSRTVKFDPKVTTIIGRNSAGKSTILRALRWICLNKPDGKGVIRFGQKEAKVILNVDDKKIVKTRNQRNGTYKLGSQVYKAFGKNVPNKIAKLLKVTESNFQTQLEPAFWFFESPGNLAKCLNKIIRLDTIDEVLSAVATAKREAEAEKKVSIKRRDEAKHKVQDLKFVPAMMKELKALTDKQEQIEKLQRRINKLSRLNKQLKHIGGPIEIPDISDLKRRYEEVLKLSERVAQLDDTEYALKLRRQESCQDQKKLTRLRRTLKKLSIKNCPTCGKTLGQS